MIHIFKAVFGTYRGIPPVLTADITGTGHLGKFGTTSIPVPDTSVSSVEHQYRYLRYRYGRLYRSWYRYRYNIDTGTRHFGKFSKRIYRTGHIGKIGTTSTRYHHIVTSKYGRFLSYLIPSFMFLLFDPMKASVFLWRPISQNAVG